MHGTFGVPSYPGAGGAQKVIVNARLMRSQDNTVAAMPLGIVLNCPASVSDYHNHIDVAKTTKPSTH